MPSSIPPPFVPPKIPTGRELFDALMAHIEPELTTESAKILDQKYAGETPENHAARMKQYELAFERYEQAYAEYMAALDAQATRYRKESFGHAELQDRASTENLLDRLGNFFSAAT